MVSFRENCGGEGLMFYKISEKIGLFLLRLLPASTLSFQKSLDRHLISLFSELQEPPENTLGLKARVVGSFSLLLAFGSILIEVSNNGWVSFVYMLALVIGISLLPYINIKKKVRYRKFMIVKALPDFINRLVLLIEAGMTLSRAFELAAGSIDPKSPLYSEMKRTISEINNGASEILSYEQLALRCRVVEVARLCGMIIQNMKKGNKELAMLLRLVASECWAARKALARKRGEEAAVGMLVPVMLQLLAVLIVTAGPAIASLLENGMGG